MDVSKIQKSLKRYELPITLLILFLISFFFFYKLLLFGKIPFPGDLLTSEYSPWRTYPFLGYNPGSIPSKVQYFDTIRQLYPWRTFSMNLLKQGIFPLWNPHNFSGHPLFANVQSAALYPLNVLYLVLSDKAAWGMLIFLQPLLLSIFTYLFARKIKISVIGSLFSSIAFSYSLFVSVFLEYNTIVHTLLWLPLILYAAELLLEKLTALRSLVFVISIICTLVAGHIQIAMLSLAFSAFYILRRIITTSHSKKLKRRSFAAIGFLSLAALGISAVQLVPAFELLRLSARSVHNFQFLVSQLLIQPHQLILYISPDIFGNPVSRNYMLTDSYPGNALYIGLIPFIFSLFSLSVIKKSKKAAFFAGTVVVLLLVFIVRSPLSEFFYSINIPLISSSSPSNIIFLVSFALSLLSGIGIDNWIKHKRRLHIGVVLSFVAVFGIAWLLYISNPSMFIRNGLVYSSGLFAVFLALYGISHSLFSKRTIIACAFILLTVIDLFYFFNKFNPFVKRELVFPKISLVSKLKEETGHKRFWGYGTASIEANFPTEFGLFSPDGYDPLYPARYGEFISSSKNGVLVDSFNSSNRSDAVIASGYGETDMVDNTHRLKIIDVLGVSYILDYQSNKSTENTFPKNRFKPLFEDNGWTVYENKKALPRAYLAHEYKVFRTKEEFADVFFSSSFNPKETLLLEKNTSIDFGSCESSGDDTVSIDSYTANSVVITTTSTCPGLLFLSDTYYPGWKALVDGREAELLRANYAFRSVALPAGDHRVEFMYKPASFSNGVKLSIISIIIFFLFTVLTNVWRIYRS